MTELDFLRDLVVLFGASIAVVYGFNRLRLPAVVGFLVAGALLGPYGLDVVDNVARVEVFAEVGVVLLLFTIGVEFSLGQLRSLRTVAGAGLLQIGSAIVLSALAAIAFGLPLNQGVFWGFLAAMSSTAVVLKMVTERGDQLSARPADHRGLDRAGPGGGADDGLDAGVGGARGGRTSGGPVVGRQGSPGGAADSRGGAVPGPAFIDRSRPQPES